MAQDAKNLNVVAHEPVFDRRKAKRLFLNFSVEISGVDRKGHRFVERTKTEDISDRGCRLFTTVPLTCGDLINIRLLIPEGTTLPEESAQQFEIMWVAPARTGWSIGARKVLGGKIWKVSFPPPRPTSS